MCQHNDTAQCNVIGKSSLRYIKCRLFKNIPNFMCPSLTACECTGVLYATEISLIVVSFTPRPLILCDQSKRKLRGLQIRFAYLLTSWSTVLLKNLTSFKLVKKFPAFYGTRRFITAFTSARHLPLS